MRYTIEFELPDNETVLKEIKTARVNWAVWGYSGHARAKPMQPEIIRCRECKHFVKGHICQYFTRFGTIEVSEDGYCDHADTGGERDGISNMSMCRMRI